MGEIFYVSEGSLYRAESGDARKIPCGAVDQYRQTVKEIQRNRGWKKQGAGAVFMGMSIPQPDPSDIHTSVEAAALVNGEKLIYASALETSCAIYAKNPKEPEADEEYITRQTNMRLYHMDYDPGQRLIVVSASDGYIEKHLALCNEERANFRLITEGESVDVTPSFSRSDNRIIHFSSAGFYTDRRKGDTRYSSYALCRYDLTTNEVTEILSDEGYDYLCPRQTADGRLYCIRRGKELVSGGTTPLDIALIPVKFLKAIFGWMNFFTQRYSGDSLIKGQGGPGSPNPAKNMDKSEQEIFIEGNLINVEKTLQENRLAGEKHPGIAPKSWELVLIGKDKSAEVVKRGVLDYTFDADGLLVYSNGKYILRRDASGGEEIVCEARVARSLCAERAGSGS